MDTPLKVLQWIGRCLLRCGSAQPVLSTRTHHQGQGSWVAESLLFPPLCATGLGSLIHHVFSVFECQVWSREILQGSEKSLGVTVSIDSVGRVIFAEKVGMDFRTPPKVGRIDLSLYPRFRASITLNHIFSVLVFCLLYSDLIISRLYLKLSSISLSLYIFSIIIF